MNMTEWSMNLIKARAQVRHQFVPAICFASFSHHTTLYILFGVLYVYINENSLHVVHDRTKCGMVKR